MKQLHRTIGRILIFAMCLALLGGNALASGGTSFPDVEDDADYAEAVQVLNDMGILTGDTNGYFNPNTNVTRAEMAAIICRALGESTDVASSSMQFSDVADSFWANGAIAKAASLGIISGYEDGTFRPKDTISYAQALTMIVRTAGLESLAIEAGGYPNGYISVAIENGLAGQFEASCDDLLVRWQVATILFGMFL